MIKPSTKPCIFKIVFTICCIALLSHWSAAQAVGPDSQTLRYSVTFTGKKAGELEVVIDNDAGDIKVTVFSHLNTVAKMFLTGLTEEAWFTVEDNIVSLHRGHTLSQDKQSVKGSFVVDRNLGVIAFEPGESTPIDEKSTIDSTAFPMALVTSDLNAIGGQHILEVSPKRARAYVYLAPEQETLELNGKSFETWKVTRHRQDDPTRTVTNWLDRNNQQLPLKIVTTKKNRETVMTLLPRS